uniref:Uncharacterized protein n=1 Tax=Anopheles melas TaxID=34690 RepID=A0A182TER3_9DIPT
MLSVFASFERRSSSSSSSSSSPILHLSSWLLTASIVPALAPPPVLLLTPQSIITAALPPVPPPPSVPPIGLAMPVGVEHPLFEPLLPPKLIPPPNGTVEPTPPPGLGTPPDSRARKNFGVIRPLALEPLSSRSNFRFTDELSGLGRSGHGDMDRRVTNLRVGDGDVVGYCSPIPPRLQTENRGRKNQINAPNGTLHFRPAKRTSSAMGWSSTSTRSSSITILPGAVPDEKDQFSATSVRSSQLCDICIALCISRSWFTSRLLLTSAHSSCRSCDIRGVRRGPGVPAPPPLPPRPGLALPFEMTASGLKLAENRRTRGVKMFENDVGSDSLR